MSSRSEQGLPRRTETRRLESCPGMSAEKSTNERRLSWRGRPPEIVEAGAGRHDENF